MDYILSALVSIVSSVISGLILFKIQNRNPKKKKLVYMHGNMFKKKPKMESPKFLKIYFFTAFINVMDIIALQSFFSGFFLILLYISAFLSCISIGKIFAKTLTYYEIYYIRQNRSDQSSDHHITH